VPASQSRGALGNRLGDVRERTVRRVRNETLHREVNDRLARLDKQAEKEWADDDELFEFLCECAAGDSCDARLQMKLAEYEQVRQQSDRFAVVPGHESADIEHIVARHERYLVVDKHREVEPYVADDPRGPASH
jgi:hypothetical protein